ncbi:hypothetical protein WJX72_007733 [[Myrmecia] bisecta]|uniref:Uncharacterized protein n=1 Tax=[Myrmecia] bisecta TaxID=41462 RepID=A0AAW1Q3U6_9CHLO
MASGDKASELSQLEVFLQQPDAIMELNILDILRRYVSDGGNPATVVEMLSENYKGYAQMASLLCSWLKMTDNDPSIASGTHDHKLGELDEPYFLRALARDKFDPEKLDGTLRGSGPPRWLNGLAGDRMGRQLIYELSAQHRNCLLLNFAVQKILEDGHENEVASIGSSLAGYFGVFHRLMANRLKEVPQADAARLDQLCKEIKESCCQGQHTYIHAQQILTLLGGKSHADLERSDQLVQELYSLYSQPEPPGLEVLRQLKVFELLIARLFSPSIFSSGRRLAAETQQAYANLLSLAAAAVDGRSDGGTLDLGDVEPTRVAVQAAVELARNAVVGTKVSAAEVKSAEVVLETPAAAMGLLHCMQAQLTSADYWRQAAYHSSASQTLLTWLAIIIPCQPLLHAKVVDIIAGALRVMGNSKPDAARGFLDLLVQVLQHGQVERVLQASERWAQAADPSLVRYLVFKILGMCLPPYSPHFAAGLIRLMRLARVRRSRTGQHDSSKFEQLEQFAAACSSIEFRPPLEPRDAAFLQELQTDRTY